MTILAPPILLKLRLLYTHWLYGAAKTWAFILTRFVGWETWPNFSPWGICEKHIWCILRYVLFTINGQKNGDYHKYTCTGFFLRKRKNIFLFIFLFPSFQFCSPFPIFGENQQLQISIRNSEVVSYPKRKTSDSDQRFCFTSRFKIQISLNLSQMSSHNAMQTFELRASS